MSGQRPCGDTNPHGPDLQTRQASLDAEGYFCCHGMLAAGCLGLRKRVHDRFRFGVTTTQGANPMSAVISPRRSQPQLRPGAAGPRRRWKGALLLGLLVAGCPAILRAQAPAPAPTPL